MLKHSRFLTRHENMTQMYVHFAGADSMANEASSDKRLDYVLVADRPDQLTNQTSAIPRRTGPPAECRRSVINKQSCRTNLHIGRRAAYQIVYSRQRCTRSGRGRDRERRRRCGGVVCGVGVETEDGRLRATERAPEINSSMLLGRFGRAVSHPVSAGATPADRTVVGEFSAAILYCTRHVAPKIR